MVTLESSSVLVEWIFYLRKRLPRIENDEQRTTNNEYKVSHG